MLTWGTDLMNCRNNLEMGLAGRLNAGVVENVNSLGDHAGVCPSFLGCQSTFANKANCTALQQHCHCALCSRFVLGHAGWPETLPDDAFARALRLRNGAHYLSPI